MAEPKTKRKRKPRRLVNLQVDEVSLVDNPAVPEATFVVVKRDEEPAVPEEKKPECVTVNDAVQVTAEVTSVEKADSVADAYAKAITTLRGVANQMSPAGLHVLGQIMEFAAFEYPDSDFAKSLRKSLDELEELGGEELAKAGRVLSKANFSRIKQASELLTSVIKSTGVDEEQEKSVDEPPPAADEVIAKDEQATEISAMDAAGELLDAREAEAAETLRKQREQQELEAVAALEQLTSHVDTRLGELASSLDGFRSEFNQARGKVEIQDG